MGDVQEDETQKSTTEAQESFIDINDQRIRVVSPSNMTEATAWLTYSI